MGSKTKQFTNTVRAGVNTVRLLKQRVESGSLTDRISVYRRYSDGAVNNATGMTPEQFTLLNVIPCRIVDKGSVTLFGVTEDEKPTVEIYTKPFVESQYYQKGELYFQYTMGNLPLTNSNLPSGTPLPIVKNYKIKSFESIGFQESLYKFDCEYIGSNEFGASLL